MMGAARRSSQKVRPQTKEAVSVMDASSAYESTMSGMVRGHIEKFIQQEKQLARSQSSQKVDTKAPSPLVERAEQTVQQKQQDLLLQHLHWGRGRLVQLLQKQPHED